MSVEGAIMTDIQSKVHSRLINTNAIYGFHESEEIYSEIETLVNGVDHLKSGQTFNFRATGAEFDCPLFELHVKNKNENIVDLKLTTFRYIDAETVQKPEWGISLFIQHRLGESTYLSDEFNSNSITVCIHPKYYEDYDSNLIEPTSLFQTLRKELNIALVRELQSFSKLDLIMNK